MQKLVLGIAMAMFFGCSTIGPQGYCEKGLYISTHIIECVAFCADHSTVSTISNSGAPESIRICRCRDGTVELISPDPQRLQCHE